MNSITILIGIIIFFGLVGAMIYLFDKVLPDDKYKQQYFESRKPKYPKPDIKPRGTIKR